VTATSYDRKRTHSMSAEIPVGATPCGLLKVDGKLHDDVADTMFPLNRDLVTVVKPAFEWFIESYLS
jgi:hypothetical protein